MDAFVLKDFASDVFATAGVDASGTEAATVAPITLPRFAMPLRSLAASSSGSSAPSLATGAAIKGRKRARGSEVLTAGAAAGAGATASAHTLHLIVQGYAPPPHGCVVDEQLLSWASKLAAQVHDVHSTGDTLALSMQQQQQQQQHDVSTKARAPSGAPAHLVFALAHARSLATLAMLPLAHSPANSTRVESLLTNIATICAAAADAALAAPVQQRELVHTQQVLLALHGAHLQALLRLGRVVEAANVAARGANTLLRTTPAAWLGHARLQHVLLAVSSSSSAPAWLVQDTLPTDAGAGAGASSVISHFLPDEWAQALQSFPRLPAILRAALAATPPTNGVPQQGAPIPHGPGAAARGEARAHLWEALLEVEAAGGERRGGNGGGNNNAVSSALRAPAAVLASALCDGLTRAGATACRDAYVRIVLSRVPPPTASDLTPALGPAADAGVHESALTAYWETLIAGGGQAPPISPACIAGVRRLLTEALSYHGAHSAGLWLLALRIEGSAPFVAAAAAGGGGRGGAAADVYARATRSLRGDAAQAFVEGAARLRRR